MESFENKKIIIETPIGQNKRSEEQIQAAKNELNELEENKKNNESKKDGKILTSVELAKLRDWKLNYEKNDADNDEEELRKMPIIRGGSGRTLEQQNQDKINAEFEKGDILTGGTSAENHKTEFNKGFEIPPEDVLEGEVIDAEKIPGETREINPEELLAAADKQGEKIDTEVKEKQNWVREKVEKTADWYKKQALWKKVLFSAGCIGVASASAAVGGTVGMSIAGAAFVGKFGQRMLGGMATFVTAEGFLKQQVEKGGKERTEAEAKRHTIEAAVLGALVGGGGVAYAARELPQTIDFIKDAYHSWFPVEEAVKFDSEYSKVFESHPKNVEEIIAGQKGIPVSSVGEVHSIEDLATIKKGEGIWHAVRRQLEEKIHGNPGVYGLKPEDLADEEKIKAVANRETGKLLTEQGYIKPDGTETWISHEGTKVLLGADNKINIIGGGDDVSYEVTPEVEHNEIEIPEFKEVEMPEIKPAYMVNEPEEVKSEISLDTEHATDHNILAEDGLSKSDKNFMARQAGLVGSGLTPEKFVSNSIQHKIHDFFFGGGSKVEVPGASHEITQPEAVHNQPVINEPVKNIIETKTALINNEIIQQHIEGNNKISEFTLNDENLRDVKFKILIDDKGNSETYILGGNFLNSTEFVNRHLSENFIDSQIGSADILDKARDLERYERAVKYLIDNNQENSEEVKILKKTIRNILEMTERKYGKVFVDKVEDFK